MGPPEEEGAGPSHEDVEIEHSRKRRADSEGEDGAVPEKPEKRSRKEKSSKKDKKKKRKKKEKSKKKKRVVSDSDAEEGYVSDDSAEMAPAEEEEAGGRSGTLLFGEGEGDSDDDQSDIASEDLFEDDDDRDRLEALPELEREKVLGERREAILQDRQRRKLLRMGRDTLPAPGEGRRGARASTRSKPKTVAAEATDALTEIRHRKDKGRARTKVSLGSEAVVEEAEGAAEEGYRYRDDMSEEAGEDEDDDNRTEAALAEIRSITVTRKQVVAWLEYPCFKEVMIGALVRVKMPISQKELLRAKEQGLKPCMYRLAEVVDIVERKESKVRVFTESFPSPYELTEGGGKTRLFMVLAIAQHRTLCPFRYVSDQPVQDEEFLLLRDQLKAEESRELTHGFVRKVRAQLQRAEQFRWTEEVVHAKLRDRGERKADEVAEKARLLENLEEARQRGDLERVARVEAELAEVEARLTQRLSERSKAALENINKRNLQANHSNILKGVGFRLDGTQLPESWVRRREVPMQIFGKGSEDQAGATAGAANGVATGAMGAHAVAEDGGAADDNPERLRAVLGALDVAKVQAARSAAATAPGVAAGRMCVGPNWLAGLTERHAELESASKMSLDEYQLRVERAAAS